MTQLRLPIIDQMRGLAVLWMIIFHFCYDLGVFGFIHFEMKGGFFTWFRFLIVTFFFISIGASLYLAHKPTIRWRAFWIRQAKITAGALIVTLSTLLMYPQTWVWFGVLHFIALASLLALPFVFWPKTSLVIGLAIFVLFNTTHWFNLHPLWQLAKTPLNLPSGTQDLTRLIPWLGMVLIGVYLGSVKFFAVSNIRLSYLAPLINFLSKHSLIIYLVHQPPLFGLAWLLHQLLHA